MTEYDQYDINRWKPSDEEISQSFSTQIKQYWYNQKLNKSSDSLQEEYSSHINAFQPKLFDWELNQTISLYPWQNNCLDNWFGSDCHGTVKVVTGAGKTIFALSAMIKLQNSLERDLHVVIVVPTIVLMEQWYDEIVANTNIPPHLIGKLGDNMKDDFGDGRRIIIAVINSAQRYLQKLVDQYGCGEKLLLIVDECHRSGSNIMQKIFEAKRKYSLGLSATPERDEYTEEDYDPEFGEIQSTSPECASTKSYNDSILGQNIGPIIFEMSLEEAYREGILPSYKIYHYGLPLNINERQKYDSLTKSINKRKNDLRSNLPSQLQTGRAFRRWLNQNNANGEISKNISLLKKEERERKALLYRSSARQKAVLSLVNKVSEENSEAKIILFHEDINEAMELYLLLKEEGFHAIPENSQLPKFIRKKSIDYFREGKEKVLVSVKSLIEGFNVPAADVGIIVASSSSVRQRIQTFGRLLRRHTKDDGDAKQSAIHVLYNSETADEVIYSKIDWDSITGTQKNIFYKWDVNSQENGEPIIQDGPPRKPLPSEEDISLSDLEPGCDYPGKYEGIDYSADSSGNIYLFGDKDKCVSNPQGVSDIILKYKGNFGRFKLTPKKRFILIRIPRGDEWKTIYVGELQEQFELHPVSLQDKILVQTDNYCPGDELSISLPKDSLEYVFKMRGGRKYIAKKIKYGEVFALTGERSTNINAGKAAERLIHSLEEAEIKMNLKINKFRLTEEKMAFFLHNGGLYFIDKIEENLEFPE